MFKSLLDLSSYETLATIATVFFFLVFVAMIVLVIRLKKSYIRQMEDLPLQSDDNKPNGSKEQE